MTMTPERWAEVNDVLHRAMQLAPEKRPAFLDSACASDLPLRREVASLLSAAAEAHSSFLLSPPRVGLVTRSAPHVLAAGTRLGPYAVQSLLGSGGMGEVYRARDIRLDRTVAVKVLPRALSSDAMRRQRFEREARAISALNHPNICQLYDVGSQDGTDYLVMEHLEGETLTVRLANGRLPLDLTLRYAAEVADALDAAHRRGIVHRDLKPGNIFLTAHGESKVLDFGLAKLEEPRAVSDTPTACATTPELLTTPGVAMGTVAYMSPEQARGEELDARTDIFSLGAVLYEMATGKMAFPGKTSAVVFKAILDDSPKLPSAVNPFLPRQMDQIVEKALEKDRALRYQSAADLRADLQRVKRDSEWSGAALRQRKVPRGRRPPRWIPQVTGSIALLLALLFVYEVFFKSAKHEFQVQAIRTVRLTHAGNAVDAAISSDGRYVAFGVRQGRGASLYLRQVGTGTDVQIVSPDDLSGGLWGVAFSPDSNYVYYGRGDKTNPGFKNLFRIPSLGGSSVEVVRDIDSPASFSPDGSRFCILRGDAENGEIHVLVVNVDGSGAKILTSIHAMVALDASTEVIYGPAWSRDGRSIAVTAYESQPELHSVLKLVSVADGSVRDFYATSDRLGRPVWLPDGRGLLVPIRERSRDQRGQLWYVSYPGAKARRLTDDLNDYPPDVLDLTPDGRTLATLAYNKTADLWIAHQADSTQLEPITTTGFSARHLSWLRDGSIVFDEQDGKIFRVNADGSHLTLLTPDQHNNWAPSACGDGNRIIFVSYRDSNVGLWRMDQVGSNPTLLVNESNAADPKCSPDGQWVVFQRGTTAMRLATGSGSVQPITPSDFSYGATFSPDGKLIAYVRVFFDVSKAPRFQVVSVPGGPPVYEFNWDPVAYCPRWSPDGKAIQYLVTESGVSNIWERKFTTGPPKQVSYFRSSRIFDFQWSPDGKTLAMLRGTTSRDVVLISGFR